MRRWKYILALLLLSNFLVSTTNIHAEQFERNNNSEEPNILIENNEPSNEIIVDKYDDKYYNSIQDAIDSATIDSTIYIRNGYYTEILNIKKKINLLGEDKEKTIINPTSKKNGYAIRIAAEGVSISNLGVNNKGPGIYTTGIKISAPDTTIKDCNFYDNPVGLAVFSSKNTISYSKFWNCADEGIAFLGSSSNKCDANIVTECEFFDNCDGIELQHSSNNKITNCKFHDNTHAGIDAIGSSNNDNLISNCEIINNPAFGIYLSRSSGNTISECTISKSKIMTTQATDTEIKDCSLDKIYLTDGSSVTINNCKDVVESKIKTINSEFKIINKYDKKDFLDLDSNDTMRNRMIRRILSTFPHLSFTIF